MSGPSASRGAPAAAQPAAPAGRANVPDGHSPSRPAADSPAFMLLAKADDAEEFARGLLILPDAVLLAEHEALAEACRNERAAFDYIAARVATLTSRRDETGAVMPGISITLSHARMALRKVAGT